MPAQDDDIWPRHPDGRPMKMGEIPRDQQRKIEKHVLTKLEEEFKRPEVRAHLASILGEDK